MEMIRHQAPRQHIGIGQNVPANFGEKIEIVVPVEEYLLAIIALVVDVVAVVGFEMHGVRGLLWLWVKIHPMTLSHRMND